MDGEYAPRRIVFRLIGNYCSNILLFGLAALMIQGCLIPDDDEQRILIENDSGTLAGRVNYTHEEIALDTSGVLQKSFSSLLADTLSLILVAQVTPPNYKGQVLQATDVVIKGQKVYVSYNTQGGTFLGGVDVFDISDISTPTLISSAIFTDTDVNGITEQSSILYLAAATERVEYDSPAVLEVMRLSSGLLTEDITTVDLPSYAGTDVEVAGNFIYVTSGASGGQVSVLNRGDLSVAWAEPVYDARGVSADDNDVGVIAGDPALLITFDRNTGEKVAEHALKGANIEFSKSTIEINRSKAILGLGDGGTQIVCLATGDLIATIPQPSVAGLDSTVTVANAATTDKKTLFMANGEAGVYVAMADTRFDSKDCSVDNLQMLGSFRFDDFQSVNHVTYRNGVLFIAGGLGGLKILIVSE